ncbi:MAG: DUF523 domain-containing protein [Myxococcales bacterium]|jgi:uncharacterized protein YbbK (DUF523 family)|nr:DUF523 domain-containing protein [Myxococcales bacterium]
MTSALLDLIATAPAIACSACFLQVRCRYDGAAKANTRVQGELAQRAERLDNLPSDAFERVDAVHGRERELWEIFEAAQAKADLQLDIEAIHPFLLRGVLPICPELFGGLGLPRTPADLSLGDGHDVLAGKARVLDRSGADVTHAFLKGAQLALALARAHGVRVAILKERSPSCGVHQIHRDGALVEGQGVTAALFAREGIEVFSEEDVEALPCSPPRVRRDPS